MEEGFNVGLENSGLIDDNLINVSHLNSGIVDANPIEIDRIIVEYRLQ
jgi:hypothetical protein